MSLLLQTTVTDLFLWLLHGSPGEKQKIFCTNIDQNNKRYFKQKLRRYFTQILSRTTTVNRKKQIIEAVKQTGQIEIIQGVSKEKVLSWFLSHSASRGPILLFHMCFGIKILSPIHLATQMIPIQNLTSKLLQKR